MRDSLSEALKKGTTLRAWSKQVTPELQRRGWWGMQEAVDPLTGRKGLVQLGSPRRLRTIYEANLRSARAAGQWERIQRTKATHPYLLYTLGPSAHHRPQHVDWSGTLLPIEDEFWRYAMPPNGYGCKCGVRQVSKVEYGRLRDKGYQDPLAPQILDDQGLPTGHREQRLVPVKIDAPVLKWRKWVNRRTGEIEHVVEGIDPGWDTNPGQAARRQQLAREFMRSVNRAPALAGAEALQQVLPTIVDDLDSAYKEWVDAIASGELDRVGGRRTIGALTPQLVQALKQKVGVQATTAGLTIEQREVTHLMAEARKGHKAMTMGQVRNLVRYLANPRAVIWDASGRHPALLYVFEPVIRTDREYGRLAVRIDFAKDGATINAVRSGAIVVRANLEQPGMVRLDEGEAL
nr:phage minor head protein [Dyella lutea]